METESFKRHTFEDLRCSTRSMETGEHIWRGNSRGNFLGVRSTSVIGVHGVRKRPMRTHDKELEPANRGFYETRPGAPFGTQPPAEERFPLLPDTVDGEGRVC